MEEWILAVGYDKDKFAKAQVEWLDYHVFIRMADNIQDAVIELSRNSDYLLVAIFSDNTDYLAYLKIIRGLTNAPILVMKYQYDGAEKIVAIEKGVDEYIQWPDTVQESVASGRSLIRRYIEPNRQDTGPPNILSLGNIFISVDYHKVFVNTQEVPFPRREFDLFYLLVSNPGRVFTQEQLYQSIWGSEYVPTENSLHSCIRRIRRKLESVLKTPCPIQNVRGVGYCFIQENTRTV